MKRIVRRGFTIVELIVVIIVLSILVMITASIYQNAQVQARDTMVRDAADKFADAISLFAAKNTNNAMPAGGYGSTSAATSTGCADGSMGFQGYQFSSFDANYKCTLADAVVAAGYLPAELFTGLPVNPVPGYNTPAVDFITQKCNDNATYLFYSQETPRQQDSTALSNLLSGTCSNVSSNVSGHGMGGYIKVNTL